MYYVSCVPSGSDSMQLLMTYIRQDPQHMKAATENTPEYLTVFVITVM